MIYILLITIILIIIILGTLENNNIYIIIIAFILIFIAGFRYGVGRDYQYYMEVYESIPDGVYIGVNEPGYILFVDIIKKLKGTQQLVFLLFSVFTVILNFYFIKKYSNIIYLSILIYICLGPLYLSSFNQVRQYLAIGIFLYSIKFIIDKKLLKYIMLLLFSSFFVHFTTILLIPLYFFLNKQVRVKYKFIVLTLYIISIPVLEFIIMNSPYSYFIIRRMDVEYDKTLIFLQIFLSFVFLIIESKFINKFNKLFFNMNFISLLLLLPILLNSNLPFEVFHRMNNYFFPYIMILLPILIVKIQPIQARVIIYSLFILFLIIYYTRNTVVIGRQHDMAPYKFNFQLIKEQ